MDWLGFMASRTLPLDTAASTVNAGSLPGTCLTLHSQAMDVQLDLTVLTWMHTKWNEEYQHSKPVRLGSG